MATWRELGANLLRLLHLEDRPIGISWCDEQPEAVEAFGEPLPPPLSDGRTGSVSAPCVFWMRAVDRSFVTVESDHGNCSVGLVTHGWRTLDEVAGNSDVATLLEAGWVDGETMGAVPRVEQRPEAIVYGPLGDAPVEPDVVLVRINAKQLMILADAIGDLRFEGKPQCHILGIAKEDGVIVASVGCMLSRVRTGMKAGEMTCAIPAGRLDEVVERLRVTDATDSAVARYASEDAQRFA